MSKSVRGVILGALGACCWGISGTLINYITANYAASIALLGCIRLGVAGIIFLIASWILQRDTLKALLGDKRSLLWILLFSLIGMAAYQYVYILAVREAGVAAESIISQTGLIYIMFFSCWRERRRPLREELLGIVLAIGGVFCIATKGDLSSLSLGLIPLALCLLDGVFLFSHNILPLEPLRKYGSLTVNAVALFLGGIFLIPFAQPWELQLQMGADGWLALGASTLIGAALGYLLSMQGLKDAGPVKGSLTCAAEPLSALLCSMLMIGYPACIWDFIGCALVIAMIVLLTLAPAKSPEPVLE